MNAYISASKHIIIAHIRDDIDKFMYHTDCMRAEKNIFLKTGQYSKLSVMKIVPSLDPFCDSRKNL